MVVIYTGKWAVLLIFMWPNDISRDEKTDKSNHWDDWHPHFLFFFICFSLATPILGNGWALCYCVDLVYIYSETSVITIGSGST